MDPDQIWTYSVDQKASKTVQQTTKADFRGLLLPVLLIRSGITSGVRWIILLPCLKRGVSVRSHLSFVRYYWVVRIGQLSITVESV